VAPARPGVTAESFADAQQALAWFTAEHECLLAATGLAAATGFPVHAWQLAWALGTVLDLRSRWDDWLRTQHIGLEAAQRVPDLDAQALAHRLLGRAHLRLNRPEQAAVHFQRALGLFQEVQDRTGEARVHLDTNAVLQHPDGYRRAIGHEAQALDLYRTAGHRLGQARALNAIGWSHMQIREYRSGIAYCQQALAIYDDLADRSGQASVWDS